LKDQPEDLQGERAQIKFQKNLELSPENGIGKKECSKWTYDGHEPCKLRRLGLHNVVHVHPPRKLKPLRPNQEIEKLVIAKSVG